jgi:hypothetical protein
VVLACYCGDVPVTGHMHPVLIKGNYQVVALTDGEEYDPEQVVAYLVMTKAGARLQHVMTLDDARSWMEKYFEEEAIAPPVQPPKAKKKRVRR